MPTRHHLRKVEAKCLIGKEERARETPKITSNRMSLKINVRFIMKNTKRKKEKINWQKKTTTPRSNIRNKVCKKKNVQDLQTNFIYIFFLYPIMLHSFHKRKRETEVHVSRKCVRLFHVRYTR